MAPLTLFPAHSPEVAALILSPPSTTGHIWLLLTGTLIGYSTWADIRTALCWPLTSNLLSWFNEAKLLKHTLFFFPPPPTREITQNNDLWMWRYTEQFFSSAPLMLPSMKMMPMGFINSPPRILGCFKRPPFEFGCVFLKLTLVKDCLYYLLHFSR